MTPAIDHVTKRAARHELLHTARLLRNRADRLTSIADGLNETADELELEARGEGGVVIGGAKITEELERLVTVGAEHHYNELDRLLRSEGFVINSRRESRTVLLAALHRSPRWESVGRRTGIYRRVAP